MMAEQTDLTSIVDELAATDDSKQMSVGEIVEKFKHRGFGPLLMIPSMIAIIPVIGAIPGVSIVVGLIIILIAGQMVMGRESPWVPKKLKEIEFSGEKLEEGLRKFRPAAQKIDKYTTSRFEFLTNEVSKRIVALLCICLAILMVPLAAVPFGVIIPAAAVLCFALGYTVEDGIVIFIGGLVTLGAFIGALNWL